MERLSRLPAWRRLAAMLLAAGLAGPAGGASAVQDLRQVEQAAADLLRAEAPDGSRIDIGRLDARLRLAPCGEGLEAFLPPGARRGASTTVGVRCRGPVAWKVFISGRVEISTPLLVATRSLARGTILGRDDLRPETRESTAVPAGALDDLQLAIGMRLRQPLQAGRPLTESMLETLPVVRRGQRVVLFAESATLAVRMEGQALSDGRPGERIRVRNSSSQRIVEGVVISAELVRVNL